jgi:hypothetical protein
MSNDFRIAPEIGPDGNPVYPAKPDSSEADEEYANSGGTNVRPGSDIPNLKPDDRVGLSG